MYSAVYNSQLLGIAAVILMGVTLLLRSVHTPIDFANEQHFRDKRLNVAMNRVTVDE